MSCTSKPTRLHQTFGALLTVWQWQWYSGVSTAAMKVASLFGSTYLGESAFSDMNLIKNKHRTRLTCKTQSCSVKLHTRLQYTGEQHAMPVFPLTKKQIPDGVSCKAESKIGYIVFNLIVFMQCNRYNFVKMQQTWSLVQNVMYLMRCIWKYVSWFFLNIT